MAFSARSHGHCGFIRQEGDEVAQRFLDHNIVKAWEDAKAWQSHAGDDERLSDEEMIQLEADVSALKQQHGETYLGGYGWATDAWRKRNPDAKNNRITSAPSSYGLFGP